MSKAVEETKLIAHEKAVEAAGVAIALVMRVPAPLKSIADQVIRSLHRYQLTWRKATAVMEEFG